MINRDVRCVYVANENVSGSLMVNWLESQGIRAELMDGGTNGGLEGVTWMAPGPSYRGIEVWVLNPADIEKAKTIVQARSVEQDGLKKAREARTGTIDPQCEDCGKTSTFPASRAGRTESCTHCRAFIDVPDPDTPEDEEFWRTSDDESEG